MGITGMCNTLCVIRSVKSRVHGRFNFDATRRQYVRMQQTVYHYTSLHLKSTRQHRFCTKQESVLTIYFDYSAQRNAVKIGLKCVINYRPSETVHPGQIIHTLGKQTCKTVASASYNFIGHHYVFRV